MKLISHLLIQVIFFIGLAAGGVFIFQNTHVTNIHLGIQMYENIPVWLCLLAAFTLGFVVAMGVMFNVKLLKKSS